MKKKIKNIIAIFLSVAILFFLLYQIGFVNVLENLSKVNLKFLVWILLFYIILLSIGNLNYFLLLRKANEEIKFKNLFSLYIFSWALAAILPGKIGEFSLVYYLRKNKINIGKSGPSFFIDKTISLIITVLFSIIGFYLIFKENIVILSSVILILIIASFLLILFSSKARDFIEKFILRKFAVDFKGFYKNTKGILRDYKLILTNILITLVRLLITATIIYLCFKSVDEIFGLSIVIVILITSIISIVNLIPLSLSGLGYREVSAVFLYGSFGIESGIIIAAFLYSLIIRYVVVGIVLIYYNNKLKLK